MNSNDIDSLNRRFGVPNHVRFIQGPGGLVQAEMENFHARATLCLQGGQILTFEPRAQAPVLWLSSHARYDAGKSVRGGIPVCWPWFGPHATDATKPAHGYARNADWRVVEASALNDGATRMVLELNAPPNLRALWPHEARLQLHIGVGPSLTVELVTRNESNTAISVTEALHTYFHVSDIEAIRIHGLENCTYTDKVANVADAVQKGPIQFRGETDRVYLNTPAECVIDDPGLRRRIHVAKQDSLSTVVWNPWTEKARKLGDMGEDGYRNMVCVEAANALTNAVLLEPGAEHRLTTIVRVESEN
jgi:D-hexose-6-phosphate mutarotase